MKDNYIDIIDMPHYEPRHPRMSRENRAAQFAPFSALTGYEELVKEMSRLTDEKIELDDCIKNIIDEKLHIIDKNIKEKPKVMITYFIKDLHKSGGEYKTIICNVKKLEKIKKLIITTSGVKIPIDDILSIDV